MRSQILIGVSRIEVGIVTGAYGRRPRAWRVIGLVGRLGCGCICIECSAQYCLDVGRDGALLTRGGAL